MEYLKSIKLNKYDTLKKNEILSLEDEDTVYCADCYRVGSLSLHGNHRIADRDFLHHSLDNNHFYFVRAKEPYEIFCMLCGDYSYSYSFDTLVHKDRTWPISGEKIEDSLEDKIVKTMGICNMGNTCFMNSILQILLHIPSLRSFFKSFMKSASGCGGCLLNASSNSNSENSNSNSNSNTENVNSLNSVCIPCELSKLYSRLENCYNDLDLNYKRKLSSIVPSNLLLAVWTQASYLAGYEQQDAHEFFIALLDGLGEDCFSYKLIILKLC